MDTIRLLVLCLACTGLVSGLSSPLTRGKLVADAPAPAQPGLPTEKWFRQKLDHFDITDGQYWQQRYFMNDTFFKTGNPIFLNIGAEGPIQAIESVKGAIMEYAEFYNAMVFHLEHRYYGDSWPVKDLKTPNMRYLTVENALEDLATFIVGMEAEHNLKGHKWVVFGTSYGGMLSVWFRYKYPHLAAVSVAESTPLPPPLYTTLAAVGVGETLRHHAGCYETIELAFYKLRNLTKSDHGVQRIQNLFQLCPFNRSNSLDVQQVFDYLVEGVLYTAMFNDLQTDYINFDTGMSVSDMCAILTDPGQKHPLQRFSNYMYLSSANYTYLQGQCSPVTFSSSLWNAHLYSTDENKSTATGRPWVYQWCTQIGNYFVVEGRNQPFGDVVHADFNSEFCKAYFGDNFNLSMTIRGHSQLIEDYGGLNIQATKVIYTQGTYDPFSKYGFHKPPNPETKVVITPGVGHGADTYASSPKDSNILKQNRIKIRTYIGEYLGHPKAPVVG